MSLGLCCIYLDEVIKKNGKKEYKNLCQAKTLQFGAFNNSKYSDQDIYDVWINNATELLNVLKLIKTKGYSVMRISSDLFPLFDLVEEKLITNSSVLSILKQIGDFVKEQSMRLTTHPSQYCLLSSNNDLINQKSKITLKHHAWVFDSMGLDQSAYYAINIHGGVKNNSQILINNINSLDDNIKSRLTLENDERGYSVKELYDVFLKTNVPIVLDTHHHTFKEDGLNVGQVLELANSTWGKIKQLTHLSNTTPGMESGNFTQKRTHSDYVHYIPRLQYEANNLNQIDIDMEFKMKNLAIEKAIKDFRIIL